MEPVKLTFLTAVHTKLFLIRQKGRLKYKYATTKNRVVKNTIREEWAECCRLIKELKKVL